MNELDDLRAAIDEIDAEMITLFEKRMDVTRRVGEYKREKGLPVLDAAREAEVLAKKEAMLRNQYLKTEVKDFFGSIMAISRRQQRALLEEQGRAERFRAYQTSVQQVRQPIENPVICYQGAVGAYAEEAAALFFGENARRNSVPTWRELFEQLMQDQADYIVVPIENSSTGSINAVYDLLAEYGAYVVGEQLVHVEHCLAALPGTNLAEIETVWSHEQGFFQSEEFLSRHTRWERRAVLNTAEAARLVAEGENRGWAAICSRRAAAIYGLEVLASGINTQPENHTRFFVVAKEMELRQERDKISLLFTLPHEPGTLNSVLGILAIHHRNLLRLESRPIPGKSWEYRFFLDVEGDLADDAMTGALFEVMENTKTLRILGNYRKGV